jgi:DNA repair exonuclease SbcCD ATPase subunit
MEAGNPAALTARLEAAEITVANFIDGLRREAATAAGRLAAIQAATEELHTAGTECPVCRRELSPEDVDRADQAHDRDTAALAVRERELTGLIDREEHRLAKIRALCRRTASFSNVRPPPTQEAWTDPEVLSAELRDARNETDRLLELAAEARIVRNTLATQVTVEEAAAREMQEALVVHRREAVTNIAAEVLTSTADNILSERIDPLATEISHRWKRVFGERGLLRLQHDGRLVLVRGVHEIPFDQFSSGEKVIALLATRLLVLGASTRASFIWLDEPLEHLDSKNRRLTASLLTTAGKQIGQILVTTYEEALARRLAASSHAQLQYVRASLTVP